MSLETVGVLATKKQVKKYLPTGYSIDSDIELYKEVPHPYLKKKVHYWAIVFCEKSGNHRLNKKDGLICKKAVEKATRKRWAMDAVGNYIFHYESPKKPRMKKK